MYYSLIISHISYSFIYKYIKIKIVQITFLKQILIFIVVMSKLII